MHHSDDMRSMNMQHSDYILSVYSIQKRQKTYIIHVGVIMIIIITISIIKLATNVGIYCVARVLSTALCRCDTSSVDA